MVRSELVMAAEVAALVALAVVQPVLGPFGESPETFVSLGASPLDIVVFALSLAVLPVLVISLVAASTRVVGPGVRSAVHRGVIAALAALIATFLARQLGAGAAVRVAVAVAVAAAAWTAHRKWEPARMFLRFAAPTSLLLVLLFLFASPVAPLVRPPTVDVGAAGASDLPPVLFIVLDELPTTSLMDGEGGVDAELFPNIARVADTSTWYRDHTSVAARTALAMPSIVTGRLPSPGAERAAVHGEYPDTVFRALAPTHRVSATEWVTELCPPGICGRDVPPLTPDATALLDAPIAESETRAALAGEAASLWWGQVWPTAEPPAVDYAVAGRSGIDELVRPGLEFLSALDDVDVDRPRFDYLHAPVPHQPWHLLPSGRGYDAPHPAAGAEFLGWADDDAGEQLGQGAFSRYLLQLQWTDRLLGAIIDRYEELGLWDDAVVVLTADHGASFERGQLVRRPEDGNQVDVFWVPLFVKAPQQRTAEVVDDDALTIDIVPTIADLAGVELDWDVDGVSLVDGRRDGSPKSVWLDGADAPEESPDGTEVELEAEGLAAILSAGPHFPGSPQGLRPWRHGRHGDLLGRSVDELGECAPGPSVEYTPPTDWGAFVRGTLEAGSPLPLWHEAVVATDRPLDVVAVLDGRVVGWNVARVGEDGATVGLLLAKPLLGDTDSDPELHELVGDRDGCALARLTTSAP